MEGGMELSIPSGVHKVGMHGCISTDCTWLVCMTATQGTAATHLPEQLEGRQLTLKKESE